MVRFLGGEFYQTRVKNLHWRLYCAKKLSQLSTVVDFQIELRFLERYCEGATPNCFLKASEK